MHRALPILAALTLLFVAPVFTVVVAADDGRPTAVPGASIRPPSGVLRQVDAPRVTIPPTAIPSTGRQVVVLVGGYQSCVCDQTFEALEERLKGAGFEVRRFGSDPAFPYDTYGAVAPNAANLRDEIRSLTGQYAGVHIVTHSMGGVVADTAFAMGLSRSDGVISYVSWSAPHGGSEVAAVADIGRTAFGGDGGLFRDVALAAGFETDSDAVRDLARGRQSRPPEGVARLDLRETSDLLVTGRDARAPGVSTRTLVGGLEGHGGILNNPEALDLTVRTIASGRVPPETRGPIVPLATEIATTGLGLAESLFLALAVAPALVFLGGLLRGPLGRALTAVVHPWTRQKRRQC